MSVHRLIALLSTILIFGLLGAAHASNNTPPAKKNVKYVVEPGLREKVQNAKIDGCGD